MRIAYSAFTILLLANGASPLGAAQVLTPWMIR
jgi:hypothetical protein